MTFGTMVAKTNSSVSPMKAKETAFKTSSVTDELCAIHKQPYTRRTEITHN